MAAGRRRRTRWAGFGCAFIKTGNSWLSMPIPRRSLKSTGNKRQHLSHVLRVGANMPPLVHPIVLPFDVRLLPQRHRRFEAIGLTSIAYSRWKGGSIIAIKMD